MKWAVIGVMLLGFLAALYAAEPFTLETIIPKKHQIVYDQEGGDFIVLPLVDYLQLQRNMDKIQRKIRESDAFADSHYTQSDLSQTNFFGYDTVYLSTKYDGLYFIGIQPFERVEYAALQLTDSSFQVTTYIYALSGGVVVQVADQAYYNWYTMGVRQK